VAGPPPPPDPPPATVLMVPAVFTMRTRANWASAMYTFPARSTAMPLRETRAIQLRIPKTDIERVEKVADRKGFSSIQGCINALLHEALDREEEQERRKAG